MMTSAETKKLMQERQICVVIPTYNNAKTVGAVVASVLPYCVSVFVVNDGSTDGTAAHLAAFGDQIRVVAYAKNRGKGYALQQGMACARRDGFAYAITLDADGQHFADDIPAFVAEIEQHPQALVVGSRSFQQENMPDRNKFANRFSNFWFCVQTGIKLQDTQSGFRLYPLQKMRKMRPHSARYEAELELLVRCAWRGIPVRSIPIRVAYLPAAERVSHFRPARDFARISLLNTILCLVAIVYGYPARFIHKIFKK